MIIKNAKIYTMEENGVQEGDILVKDGKIAKIGSIDEQDEQVIDAKGMRVYPGLIEAHCHLGMEESAIRMEGNDVNEMSEPLTPQVRAIDGCNPLDETVVNACNAGITCVAAGPGSANVIGGTLLVHKKHGISIDEKGNQKTNVMKSGFGGKTKRGYQEFLI